KALLTDSARSFPVPDEVSSGAGLLNIRAAWQRDVPDDVQSPARGTGGGSLDEARGSQSLTLGDTSLNGEIYIFGAPFDAAAPPDDEASMSSWDGGTWNGDTWSGADWDNENQWESAVWDNPTWAGTSWTNGDANDGTWDGRWWADATWQGRRW